MTSTHACRGVEETAAAGAYGPAGAPGPAGFPGNGAAGRGGRKPGAGEHPGGPEPAPDVMGSIMQSCPDAVLTASLDGVITSWNAAAARLFGYPASEATGRPLGVLAPPGSEHDVRGLLQRIGRGERVEGSAVLRLARGGRLLDVELSAWPVRGPDGVIVGACAIARDRAGHERTRGEPVRLDEQQRHLALSLQHSLMGPPRDVPGMQTASRYRPAMRGAGVGGDWFDLIPLAAGRTGVLIGDVMGRGLDAATVMGQLRSAANALARTGMPPRQLMHALDAVASDLPDQLVTCCYLIVNALDGELTACSAGHMPVLIAGPDGTVSQLPVPASIPLGVGGIPHQEVTLRVPPGSTLILYTDGLVESTILDLDARIAALQGELRAALAVAGTLEQAADRALHALLPDALPPADDVTLLLARIPDPPLASARTTVRPEPEQVAVGRRFVGDTLTAWGQPHLAATASLLVSEILTNAVRNAREPVGLSLHYAARELVVEIADDCAQPPQRMLPELAEENGRGLMIVEALADAWGTRPSEAGKVVWFTLGGTLPPGPRQPAACPARAAGAAGAGRAAGAARAAAGGGAAGVPPGERAAVAAAPGQ